MWGHCKVFHKGDCTVCMCNAFFIAAGKSTSINMMTGFLTPTRGSAMICGLDIRTDMVAVYRLMGVCP